MMAKVFLPCQKENERDKEDANWNFLFLRLLRSGHPEKKKFSWVERKKEEKILRPQPIKAKKCWDEQILLLSLTLFLSGTKKTSLEE